MRWAASLISWKNSKVLQMTWWMLRAVRASFHASQVQCVQTLSKDDFTIVFWPGKPGTPSLLQVKARTSTGWLSTWWSLRWKPWPMWARYGKAGAVDGIPAMPSTSNSPEQVNGHDLMEEEGTRRYKKLPSDRMP